MIPALVLVLVLVLRGVPQLARDPLAADAPVLDAPRAPVLEGAVGREADVDGQGEEGRRHCFYGFSRFFVVVFCVVFFPPPGPFGKRERYVSLEM